MINNSDTFLWYCQLAMKYRSMCKVPDCYFPCWHNFLVLNDLDVLQENPLGFIPLQYILLPLTKCVTLAISQLTFIYGCYASFFVILARKLPSRQCKYEWRKKKCSASNKTNGICHDIMIIIVVVNSYHVSVNTITAVSMLNGCVWPFLLCCPAFGHSFL